MLMVVVPLTSGLVTMLFPACSPRRRRQHGPQIRILEIDADLLPGVFRPFGHGIFGRRGVSGFLPFLLSGGTRGSSGRRGGLLFSSRPGSSGNLFSFRYCLRAHVEVNDDIVSFLFHQVGTALLYLDGNKRQGFPLLRLLAGQRPEDIAQGTLSERFTEFFRHEGVGQTDLQRCFGLAVDLGAGLPGKHQYHPFPSG